MHAIFTMIMTQNLKPETSIYLCIHFRKHLHFIRESMSAAFKISFLDYGAGNVRSLKNAIQALGYDMVDITT